jgi:hypothetical protein
MDFIPLPETPRPFFTFRKDLDGADYFFKVEWNQRSGWYLGLSDAEGEVIFSPKKLAVNWNLLRTVTDDRRPPGMLKLLDLSEQNLECGYNDLGQRCVLVYVPLAELEELLSEAEG